jgi:hypothetical protein
MTYQEAKDTANHLEKIYSNTCEVVGDFAKYGKGPMGLTPDHVTVMPEWIEARRNQRIALKNLQDFNQWFVKKFKKEYTQERKLKTQERQLKYSKLNNPTRSNQVKKDIDMESAKVKKDLVEFFKKEFSEKSKKEIAEEIEESLNDNGRYSSYGNCYSVTVDGEEFNLIPSFDEFHQIAIDSVTQQLEDEPESFNQDWLQHHTYITDTDKRLIAGEEAEAYTSNLDEDEVLEKYEEEVGEVLYEGGADEKMYIDDYSVCYDIGSKEIDDDATKIAAEWHGGQFTEHYKLSSSGRIDDKDDLIYEIEKNIEAVKKSPDSYDEGEQERLEAFLDWAENNIEVAEPDYDKMREALYDNHYDYVYNELEKDPMNYFVNEIGAYTEEDYLKASFVSIDIESAAEAAVQEDGEAHSLHIGNYEETGLGIIVMKE